MDIWSIEKRSAVMARIRGRDTKPELIVRSLLHRAGVRLVDRDDGEGLGFAGDSDLEAFSHGSPQHGPAEW